MLAHTISVASINLGTFMAKPSKTSETCARKNGEKNNEVVIVHEGLFEHDEFFCFFSISSDITTLK